MIYYIEGCTCSGKSTLAKEILQYYPGTQLAPEHTPSLKSLGPLNIVEKQEFIYHDFKNHFNELLDQEGDFICDFSPLGVIPFCQALSWIDDKNRNDLMSLMRLLEADMLRYFFKNYKVIKPITVLLLPPEIIIQRLKERNRDGDQRWSENFIKNLCAAYNMFFKHWNF